MPSMPGMRRSSSTRSYALRAQRLNGGGRIGSDVDVVTVGPKQGGGREPKRVVVVDDEEASHVVDRVSRSAEISSRAPPMRAPTRAGRPRR